MDNSSTAMRGLLDFFGVERPGDMKWAHEVNNRDNLKRVCASPSAMMIEGDVSYIPQTEEIIMAHYPPRRGDNKTLNEWQEDEARKPEEEKLYLEEWIELIAESGKGAKLDFKDQHAVPDGLEALRRVIGGRDIPVFLNADVLEGPGGSRSCFEAEEFISFCNQLYPHAIVSLGWTTENVEGGKYDREHFREILTICQLCAGAVTVSIKAGFLKESHRELKRFLEKTDHTFTVWDDKEVSHDLMEWMRNEIGHDRIFYDIDDRLLP